MKEPFLPVIECIGVDDVKADRNTHSRTTSA